VILLPWHKDRRAKAAPDGYNGYMSKGWDSKSVEEQQAATVSETVNSKMISKEQHKAEAEKKRRRRELELQRERILAERTSSAHRRTALTAALEEIEVKLGELGWTVHLD